MIYRGFPRNIEADPIHRVAPGTMVDPLLGGMEACGLSCVWGLHNVPFALGKSALGEEVLLPMFGTDQKHEERLAVLSVYTASEFPGEANICFGVADRGSRIGRPLFVPPGTKPNFSNVLQSALGYNTLIYCVGPADQSAHRGVVLLGDPGAGHDPEPIKVGEQTMSESLERVAAAVGRDLRILAP